MDLREEGCFGLEVGERTTDGVVQQVVDANIVMDEIAGLESALNNSAQIYRIFEVHRPRNIFIIYCSNWMYNTSRYSTYSSVVEDLRRFASRLGSSGTGESKSTDPKAGSGAGWQKRWSATGGKGHRTQCRSQLASGSTTISRHQCNNLSRGFSKSFLLKSHSPVARPNHRNSLSLSNPPVHSFQQQRCPSRPSQTSPRRPTMYAPA